MLPPQPPPTRESGVVKWLHENLFSSWLNGILTVVGLIILALIIKSALPWWLNGVWHASSLGECREIIAASAGEGATGACWAVIRERWHQFIFGFYPPALWWRPILAFGLLFVAIGPVLYAGQKRVLTTMIGSAFLGLLITLWLASAPAMVFVGLVVLLGALAALAQTRPGALLWFTAAFPALCFLLLWGGSFWTPVMAMAGFAILAVVARLLAGRVGAPVAVGLGIVAAVIWWLYVSGPVAGAFASVAPLGLEPVKSDQFGGFLLAIVIGVTAISCSLPVGILLALGRQSNMFIVKTLSVGFIEFIRGVPLITLLFTASLLLQYFLPPNTQFDIILRVIILVTFFAAAYLAEVIRGGLAALPRGQYEAADALGLDYWQAQRLIIMPQALKVSIPGIVSTFIGLFKDTTLVAFVGLMDPLKGVTQIVRADINWKGIYWEPYIYVGAIFFLICFGMSRYSMYLERKLKTDHR
ncbi:amino acid ABC transporter permease [Neotabrizicola shimadae]|uniref:Amino acid ABC transporter permease n=2 Tax=Neotabrizicola shimadae TaxID=2807096 RepID=A0A8G0ZV73_9RHOB|nr:amino acid ABC transporter permease [Neotabrizicola shimadae]